MIERKEKPCKGTSRAKGSGCGINSLWRKLGLCSQCYRDWLLNTPNGAETLKKTQIRASVKVKRDQAKEHRQLKEKNIDYSKKLQTKINEIVRLIDIGQPCLAKGRHSKQIHAGHVYSRGSNPTIKFNLHNIHRQSAQSNHFQNEDGLFREGLVNEYGKEYFEFIGSLRSTPTLNYSNEEYKVFYKKASVIALELRKNGRTYALLDRIDLRNDVNTRMGIYKLNFNYYCE